MIYELANKRTKINFSVCNWPFLQNKMRMKTRAREKGKQFWAVGKAKHTNFTGKKHSQKLIENITRKFIEFRN